MPFGTIDWTGEEDLMRTHVGSSYAKALSILEEEEAASEESSK